MPEFRLVQEDARLFSLQITEICVDDGPDHLTLWMSDCEAIQLYEAVDAGIGDYVREMRAAKAAFDRERWVDEPELLDPSDPKSEGYYERAVEAYDNRETPRAERWDW